jgi:WD40 repeat protein
MALKWNRHNDNWLISASRDHFCKLFDIRNLKEEVQCFRGHKKEACSKLFLFGYCLKLQCIDLILFVFSYSNENKEFVICFYQINKIKIAFFLQRMDSIQADIKCRF